MSITQRKRGLQMRDKCSELQCGENIIFTLTGDHIMDGNVFTNKMMKKVQI